MDSHKWLNWSEIWMGQDGKLADNEAWGRDKWSSYWKWHKSKDLFMSSYLSPEDLTEEILHNKTDMMINPYDDIG